MAAKRKAKARARARPLKPATDRQSEFLAAIARLTERLGRAPTAADIGRELGITRKGARPQLNALRDKGLVRDVPIVIRGGWALTDAAPSADALADTVRVAK